jgi:uncharacterized protein (DUF58 family)
VKARRGGWLGGTARSIVPLSARGVTVVLMAAALLALGLIRADLAALFWGASFLAYSAYAVLAGYAYRLALARRRAREPDFLSLVLPGHAITTGDQAEAITTFHLPRSLPPGFALHVHAPLAWRDMRRLDVRIPVATRGRTARALFTPDKRGVYECSRALLVANDVLGLTAHRFPVPLRESLCVVPRLNPVPDPPLFKEQTDESMTVSTRRRRSETLLEVRKYYPGDDPRRLNWKVFAHTDELFLRIGEEVPSPESRLLFVLDTTTNPLVPSRLAADYLDSLVEACGSLMAGLLSRGVEIMLSFPGSKECHTYSAETREALRIALSRAWWTDTNWQPDVPTSAPHVVVFSSPGSPGIPRIMQTVRARAWTASLFIARPVRPAPAAWRGFRSLLFLSQDSGGRAPVQSLRRKESLSLEEALSRDLVTYGASAGEVRLVAEI